MHPSLGLGGAERLIVDAAHVLAARGHEVTLFTGMCDRACAFDELQTQALDVRVRARWVPSSLAGRLKAPLAIFRMAQLVAHATEAMQPDVVFTDLVPHVLPLARRRSRAKLVYYCHFPDVLLTPEESRRSLLYRAYRRPLDRAEERGLRQADLLIANSRFTAEVARATFPSLHLPIEIVSPGVDLSYYRPLPSCVSSPRDELLLLSLARYDPRKNLTLAVDALAALRRFVPPAVFARVRLIHAGGLSADTPGSRATYHALASRVAELGLGEQVALHASISDAEKLTLLQRARALLYTSPREHFGIVPLEAMASGTPVLAVAAGGPKETVLHGKTGFLCAEDPHEFGAAIARLLLDDALAAEMGFCAVHHATRHHSREVFADRLERTLLTSLVTPSPPC